MIWHSSQAAQLEKQHQQLLKQRAALEAELLQAEQDTDHGTNTS